MSDKKPDTSSDGQASKSKVYTGAVVAIILILFSLFVMIKNSV